MPIISIAVVLAIVAAPALASAGQAPPRFPTESEIVTVDAVVLDRDGKPVRGLTRDDFRVLESGRPQAITAFEAVEARVPALESPSTRPAGASVSRVATNVAAPPTRRTFAIVFDDLHVGDVNAGQARRALEAFVGREVRPGDRLILFTTSDARYWATTRGSGDPGFREALERLASQRRLLDPAATRMSPVEAYRIAAAGEHSVADRVRRRRAILSGHCAWTGAKCVCDVIVGGSSAGGGGSGAGAGGRYSASRDSMPQAADSCVEPPGSPQPEEVYSLVRRDLEQTLRVLRAATRALGRQRERKALVLVSEGFIIDPSVSDMREVREEAARANVSFYFLDARGLATGPELLSAAGPTSALPVQDLAATIADWQREAAGPKALAEETGGLVLQTNDLVGGLATVAEESRVTYLLGYEPVTKRDGRYRRLKVEVRRPGLQVRSRAGYFATKVGGKPTPQPAPIDRALRDVFDEDGIPLRLAAYVMGPARLDTPVPKTGLEVLIAGELRLDALESSVKDGRRVAQPTLKLLTSSREGESHTSEWTLEVALSPQLQAAAAEAQAATSAAWHPFLTRVALGPGDHRARLVVQSGQRVGSVTLDLVVPEPSTERVSTPILSDRLIATPGQRGVMPLASRSFDASGTLQCWFELHGAAPVPATGQPAATAAFRARSADGREWASGPASAMSVEGGRPTRLISLPLAEAPAGESVLLLTVQDAGSGRTFELREPFRVERR